MSPARETTAYDTFNEIANVRIELVDSDPLIWRQVEVPTSITLKMLHDVEFTTSGRKYGLPAVKTGEASRAAKPAKSACATC